MLYEEGAESGKVMCIALHPYLIGKPHRAKYLDEALSYIRSHDDVWFTTGDDIAEYDLKNYYDTVVAHVEQRSRKDWRDAWRTQLRSGPSALRLVPDHQARAACAGRTTPGGARRQCSTWSTTTGSCRRASRAPQRPFRPGSLGLLQHEYGNRVGVFRVLKHSGQVRDQTDDRHGQDRGRTLPVPGQRVPEAKPGGHGARHLGQAGHPLQDDRGRRARRTSANRLRP